MNTYPEDEIKNTNNLLWKVLGPEGENILSKRETEILGLLKSTTNGIYLKIFQIISFYYPRQIASNAIKESDDHYNESSSNNELLLAITSIIDWLANARNEKRGWTKRFINFLERNLEKKEINVLVENFYIKDDDGDRKLKDLKDFARYVYRTRSLVVHNAELHGIYPFNISFDLNLKTNKVSNIIYMIKPEDFRRLLWKAILNSLGLEIIR